MPAPAQWNLDAVGAPAAWASFGAQAPWRQIKVAHLDTGVTTHPCRGAWVDVDAGINYLEPQNKPIDPLSAGALFAGHGTKTSSVLCGDDMVTGTMFSGVAPRIATIPYRVAKDVILNSVEERANIAAALRHAIDVNGCRVVTISLGFPMYLTGHKATGEALDYAYEHGVIVVGAGGQKVDRPCYPGKYYRAICVGGYEANKAGNIANIYQNYGSFNDWIDIWAPAKPIMRASPCDKPNPTPAEAYELDGDGTSYATPHVAAAAAMWLAKHDAQLTAKYGASPWQIVEAFRTCLKLSAEDLGQLPDFRNIRPPDGIDDVRPKGGIVATTGGLNIPRLLGTPLPDPGQLEEAHEAAGQWA